jgi:anaerobic selenocysteine-containing dehydrogenase
MADTRVLYAGLLQLNKPRAGQMTMMMPPEQDDPDFPFHLARGRVLHQPDRKVELLKPDGRYRIGREEVVEIHPDDASGLGVGEGDPLEVVTSDGSYKGAASLSGPQRGLVSTTTLFGQLITELESSQVPDPMLKVPRLPLVPARVVKSSAETAAD